MKLPTGAEFKSEFAIPFARFAPYYDRFMRRYVNYPAWVRYVQQLFRHYHRQPHTILDLACGTGIPTMLLAQRGYRIYGVDGSEAMLNILRQKLENKQEADVIPVLGDIRDFQIPEPADAAICLYDSINYLLTEEDLIRCFRAVQRNLKPDGIFLFDVNTVFGLATSWGDRTTVREVEDIYTIWTTTYDPGTRISTLHLTFYVTEDDRLVRYDEIHKERGYHLEELDSCLAAAGFARNDYYAHGSLHKPNATTTRVMIAARQ